jgi:hypothetical protein
MEQHDIVSAAWMCDGNDKIAATSDIREPAHAAGRRGKFTVG